MLCRCVQAFCNEQQKKKKIIINKKTLWRGIMENGKNKGIEMEKSAICCGVGLISQQYMHIKLLLQCTLRQQNKKVLVHFPLYFLLIYRFCFHAFRN